MAVLLVLLFALTLVCPGAQSYSAEDRAVIAPGGHLVLSNFTVDNVYPEDDAGSVRYLVQLAGDSSQDRFDVLLLRDEEYLNYSSGLPFQTEDYASSMDASAVPAMAYVFFQAPGDYVLLVDNSARAGVPSAAAELVIDYQVVLDNVDVQKESRWDLFIALMAIVAIIGVAFLIILRIAMRQRYKRAVQDLERKCSHCGKLLADFGEYCPNCGNKR